MAARLEEATMVDEAQLSKAVAALTAGKPVVFPTDTATSASIWGGFSPWKLALEVAKGNPTRSISSRAGTMSLVQAFRRPLSTVRTSIPRFFELALLPPTISRNCCNAMRNAAVVA